MNMCGVLWLFGAGFWGISTPHYEARVFPTSETQPGIDRCYAAQPAVEADAIARGYTNVQMICTQMPCTRGS